MRIILVHFLSKNNDKSMQILKNIEKSASAQGHSVEVCNALTDAENLRLTGYEYITVIAPVISTFGGKVNKKISEVLSTSGTVSGKKGCALVVKSGFSSNKTCKNLMKIMEAEGIVIDYFDVLLSADHATYAGKKLG